MEDDVSREARLRWQCRERTCLQEDATPGFRKRARSLSRPGADQEFGSVRRLVPERDDARRCRGVRHAAANRWLSPERSRRGRLFFAAVDFCHCFHDHRFSL